MSEKRWDEVDLHEWFEEKIGDPFEERTPLEFRDLYKFLNELFMDGSYVERGTLDETITGLMEDFASDILEEASGIGDEWFVVGMDDEGYYKVFLEGPFRSKSKASSVSKTIEEYSDGPVHAPFVMRESEIRERIESGENCVRYDVDGNPELVDEETVVDDIQGDRADGLKITRAHLRSCRKEEQNRESDRNEERSENQRTTREK